MYNSNGSLDPITGKVNFTENGYKRFWERVNKNGPFPNPLKYPNLVDNCWEWVGSSGGHGYGQFSFLDTIFLAHRFMWILEYGTIPHGLEILHKCDWKTCCRPNHLFCGTHDDNMKDKIQKGRGAPLFGEHNPCAIMTNESVLSIRKDYAGGVGTLKQLGQLYGIDTRTVWDIVNRKKWKHI